MRGPRSPRRFALVAGGGTAGHVVPAIALAQALSSGRGPESVELVGSRRGLDASLVREAGLPVTLLPGRGFPRSLSARSLVSGVDALGQLLAALVLALGVVRRNRPSVVVAMGGYASVPAALAALATRTPVVLVNVDAVPGAANRLVGRFARAAAVAYEGTPLPRAVVTGAPVRPQIVEAAHPDPVARSRAREELGIPPGRRVVAVVGGSLGARRLNEAVVGLARSWEGRGDVAIYHVVGRRDASWARRLAPEIAPGALWYHQVAYEEQMPLFYQAADLVVSRAGANTVAELTVIGVPALLVPLPGSPGDHQAANAAVLERAGAAVVVVDSSCDARRLGEEVGRLLERPEVLESMRRACAGLGRPHALEALEALVESVARSARRQHRRCRGARAGRAEAVVRRRS